MRILAIRGANLASLEAAFEVDLSRTPLGGVGLFAITGPTGAGKSTLLDALCLALFDRTPRLGARGGPLVGRADEPEESRLSAGDVRSILRRGAADGFAEVDFIGRDGHRYRARWSVRRANRRPDGRVQNQSVALEDRDTGAALGGTRTETLQAIEDRLGLSFDQFRRSALLAQGEFAAFLRADPGQRAELLERVSGTQIYGQISMAAHQRAQEAREALKAQLDLAEATRTLPPEAREQLEAEARRVDTELAGARRALDEARAAVAWHATRLELARQVGEARRAAEAAREAFDAGSADRARLRDIERVQPLRAALTQRDRVATELGEARRAASGAEAGRAAAAEHLAEARAAEVRARAGLEAATAALEGAQAELAEARRCDHETALGRAASAAVERAAAEAKRLAEAAAKEHARVAQQLGAEETRAEEADAWCAAHAAWVRLAREASLLDERLGRWKRAAAEHREAEARRVARWDAVEVAHEAARKAAGRASDAGVEAERRKAARQEAEAAEAAIEAAGLQATVEAARGAVARVDRLEARLAELRERERQKEREAGERERARVEVKRADEQSLELTGRAMQVVFQRDEAGAALDRIKAALDLADHRGALVAGEPCPLCGACEHPWATATVPMMTALAEQQERFNVLDAESRDVAERLQERQRALDVWRHLAGQAAERLAEAEVALDEARGRWTLVAGDVPIDGAEGWVAQRRAEAEEGLREALEAAARSEAAAARAREARERHEAARETWQEALAAGRSDERALVDARHALGEAETRCRDAGVALGQAREALGACVVGVAPDWSERLDTSAAALEAALRGGVAEARRQETAAAEARERVGRLSPEAAQLCERAEQLAAAAVERERARVEASEALAALETRRGALLGGRSVAEVSGELNARLTRASEVAREAGEAAHGAARQVASAEARVAGCQEAVRRLEDAFEAAEAALTLGAVALGLGVEAARALLATEEAEVTALRARLEAVTARRVEATAVLDERLARAEAHEASGEPALGPEEAREAVRLGSEQTAAFEAQLQTCRVDLRRDDEARIARQALQVALDRAQADADLWQRMAELIGSHDGKKLRVFAQSLTLDLLLAHANRHLADLARRYLLVRVPGHDLDLQVVDRDMGDEARSLHSLSGGESFLVSLALALGLSSLSSRTTPVESLFIDEGFGTLDSRTLEIALDALDALQATGCQVGLISHVPGLAERIGVRVQVQPEGAGKSRVRVVVG